MSGIENFNVTDPPTSGEVEQLALEALAFRHEDKTNSSIQTRGWLSLVVKGLRIVPASTPEEVVVRILQTTHPIDGGMNISGMTHDNRSVAVHTHPNPNMPAQATIVTK